MNKEFSWTDELAMEFASALIDRAKEGKVLWASEILQEFKGTHTEPKRDWEILKGGFESATVHEWEESCHNVGCDIWSVRRISDNTIWTVGDDCFHGPIVRFNLRDNQITADFEYGDVGCSKLLSELSKPLQRTPDSIKPPIGIMPEYIWKEQRLYELNQAIIRYINAGLSYPKEWGFERENLINETKPKQ